MPSAGATRSIPGEADEKAETMSSRLEDPTVTTCAELAGKVGTLPCPRPLPEAATTIEPRS